MESTQPQITAEQMAQLQSLPPEQLAAMMNQLSVQNSGQPKQNPEEVKGGDDKGVVKGMRELDSKNIIVDLQSQKATWDDFKVPAEVQEILDELKMHKPSITQSKAIPWILKDRSKNFMFQALNGSGKTLAFGVPAIMCVNPEIKGVQVLIIANTRELIRQVQQVISKVSSKTSVTCCIGDNEAPQEGAQIMVTVPKWIENKISGRKPLDLKNVNLVIYDEADEIFMQEGNHTSIAKLQSHLREKLSLQYQTVLFSATYNDQVEQQIDKFFEQLNKFRVKTESLKLKGVKQFRLVVNEKDKLKFINDVYTLLDGYQTMIFVQKKTDATNLQDKMSKMGIKAEKLIGETDPKMRDQIIDEFRKTNITSLISTNVLARGIDVPEVDLVINYEVPFIKQFGFKNPDYANYLHRVGRTGRFGTDGVSVTLVSQETEDDVDDDLVNQIEKYYSIEIKQLKDINQLVEILEEMRKGIE